MNLRIQGVKGPRIQVKGVDVKPHEFRNPIFRTSTHARLMQAPTKDENLYKELIGLISTPFT
jgi:hypothetical protein